MPCLICENNSDSPRHELTGLEVIIGRSTSSDIILCDATVSDSHARVKPFESGWAVEDLKSYNRTYVNGADIGVGPFKLTHGDRIKICAHRFDYCDESQFQPGSVTVIIASLRDGDPEAAERLWSEYFEKLVRAASRELGGAPRRAFDEEDIALSVIDSLCRGASRGNFHRLTDRQDLWALLLTMTHQKVVDKIRYETRKKRGAGRVYSEAILKKADDNSFVFGIDCLADNSPTPELLIELQDQRDYLFRILKTDTMRTIADLRLEGRTTREIAVIIDCTTRWVERNLERIRACWIREIESSRA